jgi:TPR repeat protein
MTEQEISNLLKQAKGLCESEKWDEAFPILSSIADQSDEALELIEKCCLFGKAAEERQKTAFGIFSGLAPKNDKAKKILGDCYFFGSGVERSYPEAERIYSECAESGDDDARYMLGRTYLAEDKDKEGFETLRALYDKSHGTNTGYWLAKCYYYGWGAEKDEKKAFEILTDASKGSDEALELLGECYFYGNGVKEDDGKAFKIFSKLAPRNEGAKKLLGDCYYFGSGVKRSYPEAERIYSECAESGNEDAKYMLGRAYLGEKKDQKGFEIFKRLYDKSHEGNVGYWLALCYQNAWGTEESDEKAFEILQNVSGENDDVLELLGECYYFGKGTKTNNKKAFKIFSKLASNDKDAKKLLGDCYLFGYGTKENKKEAERIYTECAESDDAQYMLGRTYLAEDKDKEGFETLRALYDKSHGTNTGYWLAKCYYYGWGTKTDPKKAFKLLLNASKENDDALELLGECYLYGNGTKVDEKKSFGIFSNLATENDNAKKLLGDCYFDGSGTEADPKKAEETYRGCDKENDDAQFMLGRTYLVEDKDREGFETLRALYDKSHGTNTGYWLAQCYYYGWGAEKDERKAFGILTEASKGSDDALELLGECYSEGNGTEVDGDKAFSIFKKLAPKRPSAMQKLAACYAFGTGVAASYQKAKFYLKKANQFGTDGFSETLMAACYGAEPKEKDNLKKFRYYSQKALKLKSNIAARMLAISAETGDPEELNLAKAYHYYQLEDRYGDPQGAVEMARCLIKGIGTKKNPKAAIELMEKRIKNNPEEPIYKSALGALYFEPEYIEAGIRRNPSLAFKYVSEAVEAKDPRGYFLLGKMYKEGIGVAKDTKKAEDYLQKAKETGYNIQGESPDLQLAHLESLKCRPNFDKIIDMIKSSITEISQSNDQYYQDIQQKIYSRKTSINNDQLMDFQTAEKKHSFIVAKNYVITTECERQLDQIDNQGKTIMDRFLANEAKERAKLLREIKQAKSSGAGAEDIDQLLEDYLAEVDRRSKSYAKSQKMAKHYQKIKTQFRGQVSTQTLLIPTSARDSLEAAMTIMSAYESGVLHDLKDFSPISAPLTKAFEKELFDYLGKPIHDRLCQCYPLPRYKDTWPKGFHDHYPKLTIGDYQELLDKKKNPIPTFEKDILSCFDFKEKGYQSLDELLQTIEEIRKLRNLSGHKDRVAKDDAEELKKELLGDHQDGFFYRFPSTLVKEKTLSNLS